MRLVTSICAACLMLANVAFGAATVTLTSAGSSVKNATPSETFPVDVTVALTGAEATSGISGVQFDLVANSAGLSAGAQTIQTGWDSDTVNGLALPGATGPIGTDVGPYGTAANGLSFSGGTPSIVMTLQVTAPASGGSFTLNVSGIACPIFPPSGPIPADIVLTAGPALTINVGVVVPCPLSIAARKPFYHNSCYDGSGNGCTATICQNSFNGGLPCNTDTAIDPTKNAQLPGSGAAVYANYSNFSKGINGFAIDVTKSAACPLTSASAANFVFTIGNVANPVTAAPAPSSITVASITPTTDRIYLQWPDLGSAGSIPNRNWLKIVVKGAVGVDPANALGGATGLAADDVSYFGIIIGEDNTPSGANAFTTAQDEVACGLDINTLTRFPMTSARAVNDFDKSSQVTAADRVICHNNINTLSGIGLFVR